VVKHLGFVLLLISLWMFIPGIYLTMFVLDMDMNIGVSGTFINTALVSNTTRCYGC